MSLMRRFTMNLKKIAAKAGVAGALSFAALGVGAGLAHADPPPWPVPGVPGNPGHPLPPGQGFRPGYDRDWGIYPVDRDDWRGRWVNAPWGDGSPPWGWGAPPRPDWGGPLPPPGGIWNGGPINYWGYNETPVWDQGFNQWGFYLGGNWIPL
jgi:hypothetical protein